MQSEFDDERGDFGGPASDDIRRRVRAASAGTGDGGGLELIGGVLFLVGCLPAAAVAKALMDKTDLTAEGLGGTAALASMVSAWVGPWPALAIAASVAVIGALMVIGSLRTEPLRYVAGAAVTGFGLSAIASAMTPGAGGQLGEGTGGAISQALGGAWAGVLLGLAVIAASVWFAFLMKPAVEEGESFDAPFDDDDFGPVQDDADGFGVGTSIAGAVTGAVAGAKALAGRVKKSAPRRTEDDFGAEPSGLGGGGQRRRKIQTKSKRKANPVTLGDALASGGSEGVSHDEAAALAPDEKALAYMEDVWRRASDSYQQTEPIPPSPYPEDVRLRGEIPDGAAPLTAAEAAKRDQAERDAGRPVPSASPASGGPSAPVQPVQPVQHVHPLAAQGGAHAAAAPDIAPFDFHDELAPPMPLVDGPAGHTSPPAPPLTQPVAQPSTPPSTPPSNQPSNQPAAPHAGHYAPPATSRPLSPSVTPHGAGANDPFGAPAPHGQSLSQVEADALESAVRREGAATVGPKELPEGVKPLIPKAAPVEPTPAASPMAYSVEEVLADPAETARAGDVSAQAMQAGAMPAEVSLPPAPAWETGYSEEEADLGPEFSETDFEGVEGIAEDIADVDPTGRWARRDDEIDEDADPVIPRDFAALAEPDEDLDGESAIGAALKAVLNAEAEPAAAAAAEAELAVDPLFASPELLSAEIAAETNPGPASAQALDPVLEFEFEAAEDEILEEEIAEAEFEDDEPEEDAEEDGEEEDAEAELEDEDEEAAELEDSEEEDSVEEDSEEDVEWVDEDGNPIDPEDLGEEYELVEVDEDEEEEGDELEDDEAEEYEYVDEDGNPIDPEDVDGEWEVVEDDEEDEEAAELEEDELEEPEDSEEPEGEPEEEPETVPETAVEVASEVAVEEAAEAASEASVDEAEWEDDWDEEAEGTKVAVSEAKEAVEAAVEEAAEPEVSEEAPSDAEATVILEPQAPPAPPAAPASKPKSKGKSKKGSKAAPKTPPPAKSLPGTAKAAPSAPSAPKATSGAPAPDPAPAPAAPKTPAAAASADGQRLLAAGRVVVQEGRVAVSLLQREFDMEFDEACAVLDELQQEGLIGPYKGGKARDILLTAEEWEGRFAHS